MKTYFLILLILSYNAANAQLKLVNKSIRDEMSDEIVIGGVENHIVLENYSNQYTISRVPDQLKR